MTRHAMFLLAAAMFTLQLSGTPATAQGQGQGNGIGLFAVNFCKPFVATCPSGIDRLGVCVSIVSVCNDALKTGNPNLLDQCCDACFAGAALCGIDGSICTVNFGCEPQ
jgi:hypothetical protein